MFHELKEIIINDALEALSQLVPSLHKKLTNESINYREDLYPKLSCNGINYTVSITDYIAVKKIIASLEMLKEDK